MDILIITTRDYSLFYENKKQWNHCKCDSVKSFISDTYVCRSKQCLNPIRNFFIKEGNAIPFWRNISEQLDLLFHNHDCYRIYIMPCIPEYHVLGTVDGALKMTDKERQNYLGYILDDVFRHLELDNVSIDNIYYVAHDLDFSTICRDEKVREEYIIKGSIFEQYLLNKKVLLRNVYAFKHEPSKEMYKIILGLQDNKFPQDLITSVDNVIQESYNLQIELDDD